MVARWASFNCRLSQSLACGRSAKLSAKTVPCTARYWQSSSTQIERARAECFFGLGRALVTCIAGGGLRRQHWRYWRWRCCRVVVPPMSDCNLLVDLRRDRREADRSSAAAAVPCGCGRRLQTQGATNKATRNRTDKTGRSRVIRQSLYRTAGNRYQIAKN